MNRSHYGFLAALFAFLFSLAPATAWAVGNVPQITTIAVLSNTSVRVSWNDPSNQELSFRLQRASNATFSSNLVTINSAIPANTTSAVVSGLTPGSTYFFRARAKYSIGNSAYSNGVSVALPTTTTPPSVAAPTAFSGTAASTNVISLSWSYPVGAESSMNLDRASDSGFSNILQSYVLGAGYRSYQVANLAAGTTYYFRLRANTTAGTSAWTAGIAVATLGGANPTAPSSPSGLSGSASSSSQINLTWNDNSNNETGFLLERANDSAFSSGLISNSIAANSTAYNVSGLAASTGYYFRIKALNGTLSSGYALSGAITTQSQPTGGLTLPSFNWFEGNKQAVPAVARVQQSPPQVTLHWSAINGRSVSGISIYRKLKSDTAWGANPIGTPASNALQFTDGSIVAGIEYEYKIQMSTNAGTAYGYVSSGVAVEMPAYRGKIILLVDTTIKSAIQSRIDVLKKDLNSDGWIVLEHAINQNASVPSVKSVITADYNSDPSQVKAVFLLGHIPVPYSGKVNPDGHGDHLGAWPSDGYYGDIDGNWTDSSQNWTGAANSFYNNIPGDGKFDQNDFASSLELQVGRVDFNRMDAFSPASQQSPPSYPLDDPTIYNAYLDKLHLYKMKNTSPQKRGLIVDNFTGYDFSKSGWRNISALAGPSNLTRFSSISGDPGYNSTPYYQLVNGNSYLWSYACGGGGYTEASGIGTTWNFAAANTGGVFNMGFGSYFGDWNNNNNFLRAFIAGGAGLTSVWAGIPHWQFHPMGMGGTIGESTRISMNNSSYSPKPYALDGMSAGGTSGNIVMALMGDPSLRMAIVAPPTNVSSSHPGSTFNFSWTASSEAGSEGFLGYNIYEVQTNGIRKVNSSIITGTSYSSTDPYATGKTYVVRAVKRETSETGTYINLSMGGVTTN